MHISVLKSESISGLNIKANGCYIDATFGRGGHSAAILEHLGADGTLIVFDKDPIAINFANTMAANDKRIKVVHDSFAGIHEYCNTHNLIGKIDGVLYDLGVSSPQLDDHARGFSFMNDGPLDMRMDPTKGISAAQWINSADEESLSFVFKAFGEERFAKLIARKIIAARAEEEFTTTLQFANFIAKVIPFKEKHKHPATRVFQATRIYVNNELDDIKSSLDQAYRVLAIGGRLSVISFHSLEDRIVKQFIQQKSVDNTPKDIPLKKDELKIPMQKIGKMQKPSEQEVLKNVRSRSAVLRIAEKLCD